MKFSQALQETLQKARESGGFPLRDILSNYAEEISSLFSAADSVVIEERKTIPDSEQIPFDDPKKWLRVNNVTCLFCDMANSSVLDYQNHTKRVAQVYQGFTNELVQIMDMFKASYIDIKGDGAFALFDVQNSPIYATLAAVTFKTYFLETLEPTIRDKTNGKVLLSYRTGITFGDVVFKRMGLRGDKKNEVWTNSTVNSCAKLAQMSQSNKIVVSESVFQAYQQNRYIVDSCGCQNGIPTGRRSPLWSHQEAEELVPYGLKAYYSLDSHWCTRCGETFLNQIIKDFSLQLP